MKRCLPICLLLLSFNSYGALTKWVDADGKVHYSDGQPPANAEVKKLSLPTVSGVQASPTYVEIEAERKKTLKTREEATEKAARQQEDAAAKQKYCVSLRANLNTLEKSPRIASYNEKGEKVIMDDAARRQQIEEARKQISAKCD